MNSVKAKIGAVIFKQAFQDVQSRVCYVFDISTTDNIFQPSLCSTHDWNLAGPTAAPTIGNHCLTYKATRQGGVISSKQTINCTLR